MTGQLRKIVHVDMDAFYASVEQRDDPALRGRPVVVAWRGPRSVVCAASYEARRFGIHSAMPAVRAERLCPQALFVAPDFTRYRAVSAIIHEVFREFTPLVQPLSLDEAYLDVTYNERGLASATACAEQIRAEILERTRLTASAGVAPNKFVAKIASDWRKPDGLFVVKPAAVLPFLQPLPVKKLPGVGPTTAAALQELGVMTIADLAERPLEELKLRFGRFGERLHALARGEDDSPVHASRERKSLSAETTFERDLELGELEPAVRQCAERVWQATAQSDRIGHTVVLKLKTADFQTITRSLTPARPPNGLDELLLAALGLLQRVELPAPTRFRLAGVGLSNFHDRHATDAQALLFDQ